MQVMILLSVKWYNSSIRSLVIFATSYFCPPHLDVEIIKNDTNNESPPPIITSHVTTKHPSANASDSFPPDAVAEMN